MISKLPLTVAGVIAALAGAAPSGMAQPVILVPPIDQTIITNPAAPYFATFSVAATGTPPLRYQWRRCTNSTACGDIPDATNATLILASPPPTSHRFAVTVTDGANLSVSSTAARLTVLLSPAFTTQPLDQTAPPQGTFTFRTVVNGTAPMAYQWYLNGVARSGATSSNLVVTNVSAGDLGAYQLIATNLYGAATSRVASATLGQGVDFTRVVTGPVVNNPGAPLTAAWGDYDNDGYIDLFVGASFTQPDYLYRNNRDGTFTQVLTGDVVSRISDTTSAVWGDYDNDGHLDLYISSYLNPISDSLFHNNGDGTLDRVNTGVVASDFGTGTCSAWADFNRDGWLDLFVGNGGNQNFLYRNLGDGTFLSVQSEPQVQASGNLQSAAWADYNNDGAPDLAIGYLFSPISNFLYRNDTTGEFVRLPALVPGDHTSLTRGIAWADYDNDGDLDLMVARDDGANDRLFQNQGDGSFQVITNGVICTDAMDSSSPAWGDYDNDGWLDLFVTGNSGFGNRLYHNSGDGTFTRVAEGQVATEGGGDIGSFGAVWGDYDNDGSLDLFVANAHPNIDVFSNRRSYLYHNNGTTNRWVMLRLIGTVSNRSAIGAKVRLKATIRGRTFWQMREISGGTGLTGQNDMRAHFGLGDASRIEAIRIEWPSGAVQEISSIPMNQIHTITEPPRVQVTGWGRFQVSGWPNLTYRVQASSNLVHWESIGTATTLEESVDPNAGRFSHRFYRVFAEP